MDRADEMPVKSQKCRIIYSTQGLKINKWLHNKTSIKKLNKQLKNEEQHISGAQDDSAL